MMKKTGTLCRSGFFRLRRKNLDGDIGQYLSTQMSVYRLMQASMGNGLGLTDHDTNNPREDREREASSMTDTQILPQIIARLDTYAVFIANDGVASTASAEISRWNKT